MRIGDDLREASVIVSLYANDVTKEPDHRFQLEALADRLSADAVRQDFLVDTIKKWRAGIAFRLTGSETLADLSPWERSLVEKIDTWRDMGA